MLRDRIKLARDGFKVVPETDADRKIVYCTYSFEDKPEMAQYHSKPDLAQYFSMQEGRYWSISNNLSNPIKDGELLYVAELEGDIVADSCRFYIRKPGKNRLAIYTQKAPWGYASGSFLVTVEWVDGDGEPFHGNYIWLRDRWGNKYPFLKEIICPRGDTRKKLTDKYIYRINGQDSEDDYRIEIAEILREKYDISIRRLW